MPNETVKILVLETDETHPDTMKEKGGFGVIFHELMTEAGNSHEPPLNVEIDMHFVVHDPVRSWRRNIDQNSANNTSRTMDISVTYQKPQKSPQTLKQS